MSFESQESTAKAGISAERRCSTPSQTSGGEGHRVSSVFESRLNERTVFWVLDDLGHLSPDIAEVVRNVAQYPLVHVIAQS